jgi:hypothetical protein
VYYNAVANFQLGKFDLAEKSAREAASMDSASQNPKIQYVLAVTLANKQDFKGAAGCLRIYLKSDAITDRERVTKMLADIEKQAQAKVAPHWGIIQGSFIRRFFGNEYESNRGL